MTMVSVRKEPPGRLSEPIKRKLTVSCPLLRIWLPEGSIVERGASVLISMFASTVGTSVCVGAMEVEVRLAGSNVGEGAGEPVCVQGIGRKGVGVAVELGAAVTRMNGSVV